MGTLFTMLRDKTKPMVISIITGLLLMFAIIEFHHSINNNPQSSEAGSVIFLLFARPLFIFALTMVILPIIVDNKSCRPIARIMSHEQWLPSSRLVYGVFLNNTILMQFSVYNAENGLWISKNDLYLLYLSYMAISFICSNLTYILVEAPMATIIEKFMKRISKFKSPEAK